MPENIIIPDFIEAGDHEKGFAAHFKDKIVPLLETVEENRLIQYASFKIRMVIAIIAAILITVGAIFLESQVSGGDGDGIKIGIFLIICIFGWAYLPVKRYKEDVKSKFMPVICGFYGNMTYTLSRPSSVEDFYMGQIFPQFNRKEVEDFIEGEYRGVKLNLHETKLIQRQRKSNATVFRGLVLELELKKQFNGKTLLKKDEGSVGNFFRGEDFVGLKRTPLEDPEFEKIFQVFTGDPVEARFVLTTAFMERLLALARLRSPAGTPTVECVFELNKMIISIPSQQNLFEPKSIRKTALQTDDIHSFLAEMKDIFLLVDTLKVNRN